MEGCHPEECITDHRNIRRRRAGDSEVTRRTLMKAKAQKCL